MPICSRQLLGRVKDELRINADHDDARIMRLIDEGVYSLQQFKNLTLTDTITDAATQATLTPLDIRYIVIYVGLQYDGDSNLDLALGSILEQVRDK